MTILRCGNGKFKVDDGPCRFASRTAAKKFQSAMKSSRNPPKKEFLQVEVLQAAIPAAEERLEARVWMPFYQVFLELDGDTSKLTQWWKSRREDRLVEWFKDDPVLWDEDGAPTETHLKAIMWAYSPEPQAVLEWVATIEEKKKVPAAFLKNIKKKKGGDDDDDDDDTDDKKKGKRGKKKIPAAFLKNIKKKRGKADADETSLANLALPALAILLLKVGLDVKKKRAIQAEIDRKKKAARDKKKSKNEAGAMERSLSAMSLSTLVSLLAKVAINSKKAQLLKAEIGKKRKAAKSKEKEASTSGDVDTFVTNKNKKGKKVPMTRRSVPKA